MNRCLKAVSVFLTVLLFALCLMQGFRGVKASAEDFVIVNISIDATEVDAGTNLTASYEIIGEGVEILEAEWWNGIIGNANGTSRYLTAMTGETSYTPCKDGICYFTISVKDADGNIITGKSNIVTVHGMVLSATAEKENGARLSTGDIQTIHYTITGGVPPYTVKTCWYIEGNGTETILYGEKRITTSESSGSEALTVTDTVCPVSFEICVQDSGVGSENMQLSRWERTPEGLSIADTFSDSAFRTYISSKFDRDSDGVLTKEEIRNIVSISCNSKGIESLAGIEHLTSLDTLFCNDNNLKSLDLSENAKLKVLYCENNQLNTLNVRNCNLTVLQCQNNQLSSLDLSDKPALAHLNCKNNKITGLDITACTAIVSEVTGREALYWENMNMLAWGDNDGFDPLICDSPMLITIDGELYCNHRLKAHAKTEATCTTEGAEAYWNCVICGKYFADAEHTTEIDAPLAIPAHHLEVIDAAVAATCTETGLTEGKHCSVCNEVLAEQETIPATGHEWAETTYEWMPDNTSVIATHICKNDRSHRETETVSVTVDVLSPTDSSEGLAIYLSGEFSTEEFSAQKKEIVIPALKDMSVLILPQGLTIIEEEAFCAVDCQAIVIPEGCTDIGERAFAECANLIYIRIPSSVKVLAENAFSGCNDSIIIDWEIE